MELGKHERKVSGREALEEKQMVRYVEKRWLLMSFFFFFLIFTRFQQLSYSLMQKSMFCKSIKPNLTISVLQDCPINLAHYFVVVVVFFFLLDHEAVAEM